MNLWAGSEFERLCKIVGLITLSWAWAETNLAATIGIVNGIAGPIKGHPKAPLSLKNRVKCLRAALSHIPELEPVQEIGRTLAERFTELSLRRNEIVHSAVWDFEHEGFQATALGVKDGESVIKNHRFNESDAALLAAEVGQLSDDAKAFMLRVADILSTSVHRGT